MNNCPVSQQIKDDLSLELASYAFGELEVPYAAEYQVDEMVDAFISSGSLPFDTAPVIDTQTVIDSYECEDFLANIILMVVGESYTPDQIGTAVIEAVKARAQRNIIDNMNSYGEVPTQFKQDEAA